MDGSIWSGLLSNEKWRVLSFRDLKRFSFYGFLQG
jgi:hypothetical protein